MPCCPVLIHLSISSAVYVNPSQDQVPCDIDWSLWEHPSFKPPVSLIYQGRMKTQRSCQYFLILPGECPLSKKKNNESQKCKQRNWFLLIFRLTLGFSFLCADHGETWELTKWMVPVDLSSSLELISFEIDNRQQQAKHGKHFWLRANM